MEENFNPFSLSGKRILVTGASSGIGRSIAIACAKMGALLIITGRNDIRLSETLEMLPGEGHMAVQADITITEDINRIVDNLPALDGIVQCAGVASRIPCKQIQKQDLDYVINTNFEAPVLLQSAILSKKKIKKESSIVFIASRAYQSPSMGNAAYSASKGAIISYSKCLALELAPRLIRVNCICPGMIWTDLITKDLDEGTLQESQLQYPLRRFGKPEDVANLAIYLLSDASAWMTGSCLDISGGGEGILT